MTHNFKLIFHFSSSFLLDYFCLFFLPPSLSLFLSSIHAKLRLLIALEMNLLRSRSERNTLVGVMMEVKFDRLWNEKKKKEEKIGKI